MKKMTQLNYQLFLTIGIIIIGSIIAFGMILPISMSYFFDNRIYNDIEEAQKAINPTNIVKNNGQEGIYHILYSQLNQAIDKEISEELLHQRLMYKEFFEELKKKALAKQHIVTEGKYMQGDEVIYYMINRAYPNDILISYKVDDNPSILLKQLFINVLMIITITISIILLIFFKWNARLINNLKDIQLRLDGIGEGDLKNAIQTTHYTVEFQEVMNSLERMRQKLYMNEQVKQDMIHNISHDLKTPLAVIKNYAEGIIDSVYPYGTVEETAHVIYNQADRLQKRVQGLLYLNRLEYIKSQQEIPQRFNMKKLTQEVVCYMKDREDKAIIQVELEEAYFLGDVEKWRIVLENLIDNAKRYAEQQIVVTVKAEELSVYNDGMPIDESIRGSLFSPFEVGSGGVTGLGLSIVKKTVELYGYHISFRNEDKGVTFIIRAQRGD